jgi:hypothetical protein
MYVHTLSINKIYYATFVYFSECCKQKRGKVLSQPLAQIEGKMKNEIFIQPKQLIIKKVVKAPIRIHKM